MLIQINQFNPHSTEVTYRRAVKWIRSHFEASSILVKTFLGTWNWRLRLNKHYIYASAEVISFPISVCQAYDSKFIINNLFLIFPNGSRIKLQDKMELQCPKLHMALDFEILLRGDIPPFQFELTLSPQNR